MRFMNDLAIILLNYNGSRDTIECIQSLDESETNFTYHVYIMDNNSKSSERDILEE